jgi:hypothetical protein
MVHLSNKTHFMELIALNLTCTEKEGHVKWINHITLLKTFMPNPCFGFCLRHGRLPEGTKEV